MTFYDYKCIISPQAWGCTELRLALGDEEINLPTSVGMYRLRQWYPGTPKQSPHKRGDVPIVATCMWVWT